MSDRCSPSEMERALLERDEEQLRAAVAREIRELSIRGPFLDIGAGTGLWVAMVREAGEAAYGIDALPALVETGRRRYRLETLILADGRHLPFPTGYFRWIQLREVIEHVDRSGGAALMREINRVLLPGGLLRLTTPNRLKYAVPTRNVLRGVSGLLGKADDQAHVHEYWPWELRRLVTASGYRMRSLRYRARNRYIPWGPLAAGIDIIAAKV